jgi:hypothetical protein
MPIFMVETYMARSANALQLASASAHRTAELATTEGATLRYLRTTFIPGDEICLHLFEASSASVVQAAAARAGLECDRIVEALT